ncbi:death on curing protein [Paramicrobacterium humi]|uniref:Death on curing protein n=1 Tax=Paramicrobacterium humi TaxID=640635 RepID=A0A1H4JIZ1_9MICO|nr:type II toxin-antitoxin system death-on-curing family toxin [Microbacterium humi]SEB46284.1 death on curing protein [Microbacterium humi]
MTEFLEIEDALQVVKRLGFHVRDLGLLASAVVRPSMSVFGEDAYPRLNDKAAALLESLARSHALIDGNKRSAWTIMRTFLWINGFRLTFTTEESFDLVIGVASGKLPLDESSALITRHLVRVER